MATPVAVKIAGPSLSTVASTVLVPGRGPRVRVVAARPSASVAAVVTERDPSPVVTGKGDGGSGQRVPVLIQHPNHEGLGQGGAGRSLRPASRDLGQGVRLRLQVP